MSVEHLQSDLISYDARNWLHAAGFETDRHNLVHVLKTAGKIAAQVEAIDDQREPETPLDATLVADLAIGALRFANNGGYDLQKIVEARMQELHERAHGPGG